jgi:hypothetical protein
MYNRRTYGFSSPIDAWAFIAACEKNGLVTENASRDSNQGLYAVIVTTPLKADIETADTLSQLPGKNRAELLSVGNF